MSYSGDAAEQVVRMTLEGAEVAARISGQGAKEVALLLYAVLKDQKKTKGKARLTSMLRTGKELKVFAVQDKDLVRFSKAAKQYGVLYCVLKDRDAKDGLTDVMVRAEDASKVNRIFERFKLTTVDMASVRSEIERAKANRAEEKEVPERYVPERSKEDVFLDAIMANPSKDEQQNPMEAWATKSPLSGSFSRPSGSPAAQRERGAESNDARARSSVRQEMRDIRAELERETVARAKTQQPLEHKAPKKKQKRKER